jgi:hypothetical protein
MNHSLGKLAAIYDKGQYLDRWREAMHRLGGPVMDGECADVNAPARTPCA